MAAVKLVGLMVLISGNDNDEERMKETLIGSSENWRGSLAAVKNEGESDDQATWKSLEGTPRNQDKQIEKAPC